MFYQMNLLMLANELIQYFRNTSIATTVSLYFFSTAMGNTPDKPQPAQTGPVTEERKPKAKKRKVYLMVLYKNGQETHPGTDNLCDALDTYPPPGSIEVHHKETEEIQDGHLPEPVRSTIQKWISHNHIVLICLLTDCDLGGLDDGKIIVFCFKNPPVSVPCTCVDADFYTASPGEMRDKLDEVAAKIKA